MTTKERYEGFINWFSENMPVAESELKYQNPFELLVAVILSAISAYFSAARMRPHLPAPKQAERMGWAAWPTLYAQHWTMVLTFPITPVSYTHLDVYKRQGLVDAPLDGEVGGELRLGEPLQAPEGQRLALLVEGGVVPVYMLPCLLYTSRCV